MEVANFLGRRYFRKVVCNALITRILFHFDVLFFQERLQLEEKLRKQEMELDYLAPFLAQMGIPERLTRQQAYRLKEDCLADLKQRLIDKANLIQARFEKVRITRG